MKKYKHRPYVVEAMQWKGPNHRYTKEELDFLPKGGVIEGNSLVIPVGSDELSVCHVGSYIVHDGIDYVVPKRYFENTHTEANGERFCFADLVKKATPEEPIYEADSYANGELAYDIAFCPSCDADFERDSWNWGDPYCPKCGQALDWGKDQ